MALPRDFKGLVQKRIARDPAFADALLREGIDTCWPAMSTPARRMGDLRRGRNPQAAVGRDRLVEPAGRVVAKGPEQGAGVVGAMTGRIKVIVDEAVGAGMQRQIARLAAFAGGSSRSCAA